MTVGLARSDRPAVETRVGIRDGVIVRAARSSGDRLADEDGDCGRVEAGVADRDVVVCRPRHGNREQDPTSARAASATARARRPVGMAVMVSGGLRRLRWYSWAAHAVTEPPEWGIDARDRGTRRSPPSRA